MHKLIVFILTFAGAYLMITAFLPVTYAPAGKALRIRQKKKTNQTDQLCLKIADRIVPLIDLDPVRRSRLQEELRSMGYTVSPERFRADALAKGVFFGVCTLVLVPLFPVPALAVCGLTVWAVWNSEEKKLQKALDERKTKIERKLPQFCAIIHQSLDISTDVIQILKRYLEVCSPELAEEIQRTINEAEMGSPEVALKSFETRIASVQLSQLTRGLIGVLRGDDRKNYFDGLTRELQKAATESAARELELRPKKLYPHMGLLFFCLILQIAVALGLYMIEQYNVIM